MNIQKLCNKIEHLMDGSDSIHINSEGEIAFDGVPVIVCHFYDEDNDVYFEFLDVNVALNRCLESIDCIRVSDHQDDYEM